MLKKTAIAVAIASAAAVPFAAQAAGPTLYGRVDLGLHWTDTGTDTIADLDGSLSRFGIKGDADLGGGLNGFYKFEFRVLADNTTIPAGNRLSYLGVKSGFGSVSAGRQWSAYYNSVGTHVDPTEVVGTAYLPTYLDRISDVIKYSNTFGPVTVEADVKIDGAGGTGQRNGVDEKTVGVTFATGPITVAGGYDSRYNGATANQETDTVGVAGAFKIGDFVIRGGIERMDDGTAEETTAINVGGLFSSGNMTVMGGVGKVKDDDIAQDDKVIWAHFAYQIAKPTKAYVELRRDTPDVGEDTTQLRVALTQDF